jgi:hypothetical protein
MAGLLGSLGILIGTKLFLPPATKWNGGLNANGIHTSLPDGVFAYQKLKFWYLFGKSL